RVIDLTLPPDIRRVIEIAFRIHLVEADGGGDEFLLDGLDRGDRFDDAPGAKAMAVHRLGGRDREFVRGVAEHALDGAGLVEVVDGRRGAVGVDVIDIARARARAL